MKLPKEKSTLLWESALRELSASLPGSAGVPPASSLPTANCQLPPADLVWLHTLARRVYHPDGIRLAFARAPIQAGGIWLYPLALCWLQWLEDVAKWWGPEDLLPTAYACAYSDGSRRPIDPSDPAATRALIHAWAANITISAPDLQAAVQWLLGNPEDVVDVSPKSPIPNPQSPIPNDPQSPSTSDWGELLCLLAGAYHLDPWEICMKPVDDVVRMLEMMPSPGGIYAAPTRDQRRKTALAEFQAAVRMLKRKYADEQAKAIKNAGGSMGSDHRPVSSDPNRADVESEATAVTTTESASPRERVSTEPQTPVGVSTSS